MKLVPRSACTNSYVFKQKLLEKYETFLIQNRTPINITYLPPKPVSIYGVSFWVNILDQPSHATANWFNVMFHMFMETYLCPHLLASWCRLIVKHFVDKYKQSSMCTRTITRHIG